MKRILFCTLLLSGTALPGLAQSKLDMVSRAQLRARQLVRSGAIKDSATVRKLRVRKGADPAASMTLGFVKLVDGADAGQLENAGAKVLRRRGNIAIVEMPDAQVERISNLACVRSMQLNRTVSYKMDLAREASQVNAVHTGLNLPRAYTGKGIVAGVVDGGMDPNHINFKNEDGTTRVKYLGHLRVNSSGTQLLETRYDATNVNTFTTDDKGTFHGAHTMGIMAGGYKGEVTAAQLGADGQSVNIGNVPCPYYGVATGADIAASCGTLVDAAIAYGIDDILQYAYDNEQRSVINLSLGSNIGPHDGSDIIHQYIDEVVKQDNAIICVSAGNEGDIPIALNGTFGPDRTEVKTFIRPYVYTDMRYGNLVVYSNDATEFEVQAVIYNQSRGRISFRMPVAANTNGEPQYWVSSADYQSNSSDAISPALAAAFDGYVGIGTMTDENTGRYYAMIDYYTVNSDKNADDNYLLGFVVTGKKDGQRVDCYCDGSFTAFDNYGYEDWDNGMFNGTISDMACGRNILVVGSYNTRDQYASLDGGIYSYQGMFAPGKMSEFTSYGTLPDGRNLPHVCAPGATIVSSSNTYFVEDAESGITDAHLQAKVQAGGRNNYWQQMIGTSMATPYVTGTLATWLEADPTLTIDDIKDIVAKTSIKDDDVASTGDAVQWGAGKFDAYEGLKEVIRRAAGTGIDQASSAASHLVLNPAGIRAFDIFLGGAKTLDVKLYNPSGVVVKHSLTAGDETRFDASGLTPGVYLIKVNDRPAQRVIVD